MLVYHPYFLPSIWPLFYRAGLSWTVNFRTKQDSLPLTKSILDWVKILKLIFDAQTNTNFYCPLLALFFMCFLFTMQYWVWQQCTIETKIVMTISFGYKYGYNQDHKKYNFLVSWKLPIFWANGALFYIYLNRVITTISAGRRLFTWKTLRQWLHLHNKELKS